MTEWKVKLWFSSKYHDTTWVKAPTREEAIRIARADAEADPAPDYPRTYIKVTATKMATKEESND